MNQTAPGFYKPPKAPKGAGRVMSQSRNVTPSQTLTPMPTNAMTDTNYTQLLAAITPIGLDPATLLRFDRNRRTLAAELERLSRDNQPGA